MIYAALPFPLAYGFVSFNVKYLFAYYSNLFFGSIENRSLSVHLVFKNNYSFYEKQGSTSRSKCHSFDQVSKFVFRLPLRYVIA